MSEVQIIESKLERAKQRLILFKQRAAPAIVIKMEQLRVNTLSAALRLLETQDTGLAAA